MINTNNFFDNRRVLVDVQNGINKPVNLTVCQYEYVVLAVSGTGIAGLPIEESADGVNWQPFVDLSGNAMTIAGPGLYKLVRLNQMIRVNLTGNTSTDLMVYIQ